MWTKRFSGDRKVLYITGPMEMGWGDFTLKIDHDDVPQDEVEAMADLLIEVLDKHWPAEKAEQILKQIREKYNQPEA